METCRQRPSPAEADNARSRSGKAEGWMWMPEDEHGATGQEVQKTAHWVATATVRCLRRCKGCAVLAMMTAAPSEAFLMEGEMRRVLTCACMCFGMKRKGRKRRRGEERHTYG